MCILGAALHNIIWLKLARIGAIKSSTTATASSIIAFTCLIRLGSSNADKRLIRLLTAFDTISLEMFCFLLQLFHVRPPSVKGCCFVCE